MTKFIVLRGPSGSGKSSVAKAVRIEQLEKGRKIAYVEQDYFRRTVLKEKDIIDGFNIKLIEKNVIFLLDNGYDVVMEGIFDSGRYCKMFESLISYHPENNYFFYFDISLAETIKRHNTKPNRYEFGELELKSWYKKKDLLSSVTENIIDEDSSMENTVSAVNFLLDRSL